MEKRKLFHLLAKIHNIPLEEAEVILLEPGSRLGLDSQYEIINLLGTGSIGAVYLAKDYQDEQSLVALKIVLPYIHVNTIDRRMQLFTSHLDTLKQLDHPNIVQLKDSWEENTLQFYTMEYVPGYSLKEWMQSQRDRKKKISCAEACEVFLQISQGLALLHRYSGHYRLHPENILCSKKSPRNAKICDFGIYCLQSHSFWQETAITLDQEAYQSPEQQKKLARLSVQSDIFTLGVMLYEVLTGQCPELPRVNPSEFRKDIPEELERLITASVQKNTLGRPKTAEQFIARLEEAMEKVKQMPSIKEDFADLQKKPSGLIGTGKMNKEDILKIIPLAKEKVAKKRKIGVIKTGIPGQKEAKLQPSKMVDKIEETAKLDKTFKPLQKLAKSENAARLIKKTQEPILEKKDIVEIGQPHAVRKEISKPCAEKIELCNKLASEKKWEELIEYCEQILREQADDEVEEILGKARDSLQQAEEYKQLAIQMKGDPSSSLDLLRQSMEIYPQDMEAKQLYGELEKIILDKKENVDEALTRGDELVGEEKYEEALKSWQNALGFTDKDKEIRDRIMQVVDLQGEIATDYLDSGEPYKAKSILDKILDYTDDLLIIELFEETEREIQERENQVKEALKEGNKHFEKKQFAAAIDVWKNAIGLTDQDEEIMKKIKEAKKLGDKTERDEQDYLRMSSLARALEQREDYESSLQTWQKIQQQQSSWICPTRDIDKEIEKLTKLVAATNVSSEAKKILLEAENSIKKGKYGKALALLSNPIFHRKLLPSAENKFHSLSGNIQDAITKRKRIQNVIWIILGVLAAVGIAWLNFL